MKYFHSVIITGFLIPLLSIYAEEIAIAPPEEAIVAESEAAVQPTLEKELSLLDEEFEELFSLDPPSQKQEETIVENLQETMQLQEEPLAIDLPKVAEESMARELAPVEVRAEEVVPTAQEITEAPATPILASLPAPETAALPSLSSLKGPIEIDLQGAFAGSPVIYSILLGMSVFAVSVWLYALLSLRYSAKIPKVLLKSVHNKLGSNHFDEALSACEAHNTLFSKMLSCGIHSRRHGLPVMIEAMKAEGKRASVRFWQKIGLLSDIAVIAPMLGLLGTVLGMFYAFYDVNRSMESISSLFDGLGVSVGTTVAGLIVAILALILQSTAKFQLVKALAQVENEAQNMATLIEDRTSIL